jgi:DsbC/DsbD-like thiol-disulfide interchange protein
MRIQRLLPFAFCLFLVVARSAAEEPPVNPTVTAAPPVRSLLLASRQGAAAGDTLILGVLLEPAAGWHLYWNGINDTGLAPLPRLRLPAGAVWLEDWRWPAPERLVSPGKLLDHIYTGRLLLTAAVLLPAPLPPGEYLAIEGRVDWVACREACRFGSDSLSLHLPFCTQAAPTLASAAAARLAEARAALPLPLAVGEGGLAILRGDHGLLLSLTGATALAFYPARDCVELLSPLADAETIGSRLNLRLAHGGLAKGHLRGILAVLAAGERRHYLLDHPLDPLPEPEVDPTKE